MYRQSRRSVTPLCVLFITFGITSAAEPPVVAPKPVPVFTAQDLLVEDVRTNGELLEGSPAALLGSAIDVTEAFLRLSPEQMKTSDRLSRGTSEAAADSEPRIRLSRFAKLKESHRFGSLVDSYLADDRLAVLLVVFTPRPENGPKTPALLYAIRDVAGDWRLSFDIATELDEAGRRALRTLEPIVDKRLAEIESVVTRPLKEAIDFRGTWHAHFRQTDCYFSFDGFGEVFVYTDRGNGTASYGVFDYHLSGEEVIVEHRFFPLRLRRHPDGGWHEGGRWYPILVADDLRFLFAEYPDYEKGPSQLVPVRRAGGPLSRPVLEGTDATRPVDDMAH